MVIHLDADAFIAPVEHAADRMLRGETCGSGGSKRGIVASAGDVA